MRCSNPKLLGLLALALITAAPTRAEVRIGLAAPLTGPQAWMGGVNAEGARVAVADLNAKGGVLGEQIEMITADDYCSGEQAIAAANKLVAAGAVAVFGHPCSGAAIPASKVYSEAGLLMVSSRATNPKLTEQDFRNVFRVVGRDDLQGRIAGDLLAKRWGDRPIAILHDGQAYGKGLAEETRKRLNERGIAEAMFEAIEPGKADYWDVVQQMRAMGIEVFYFGGYTREAGLIIRQARAHGHELQLVGGDGLAVEDFALIAGPASEGTLMTRPPEPLNPEAAEFAAKATGNLRPSFEIYAAVQAWAQAVDEVGTFETQAVAQALRSHEFDTVLGGTSPGTTPSKWYQWRGGDYEPVDPGKLTE